VKLSYSIIIQTKGKTRDNKNRDFYGKSSVGPGGSGLIFMTCLVQERVVFGS